MITPRVRGVNPRAHPAGGDATTIATQGYGVGNYYFVNGDTARARTVFEQVTSGAGWNAFGYIAAEADLVRMRP